MLVFGRATEAVMDAVGIDSGYRKANNASLYTVEAHVRYLAEVRSGADLRVRSSVIGSTGKLMWLWHERWVEGRLRATEEILGVHVTGGSSSPFPAAVAARVRVTVVDPLEPAGGRIRALPRDRPGP